MISIDPTVLIVMGEAIVGLIVIVAVIVVVMVKRQRRTQALLAELNNRLRQTANERQVAYENMLGDLFEEGDDGECANVAQGLVAQENEFYGRLIEMYMKRNSSTLRQLDKHMQEFSTSYTNVIADMRAKIEEGAALEASELTAQLEKMASEHEVVAREIEEVRAENERLGRDLDQAYKEIDQAMSEYSAAFRGPNGEIIEKPEENEKHEGPGAKGAAAAPAVAEPVAAPDPVDDDNAPSAGTGMAAAGDDEDVLAQWNEALGEAETAPPDAGSGTPASDAPNHGAAGESPVESQVPSAGGVDDDSAAGLLDVKDEIPSRSARAAASAPAAEDVPLQGLLTAEEEDDLLAELEALGIGDDDLPELGDIRAKSEDVIDLADDGDLPGLGVEKK